MGDAKNFNTLGNVFARLNDKTNENEEDSTRIWGNIPQHMFSKLIPDLGKAYRVMMASMSASMNTFNKKIKSAGLTKETKVFGDPKAEDMANDVSSAIKVNITSNLGDCARIWESMRRLRVYDPSVNAKQPFEPVSNKTPDGNPAPNYTPVTDAALAPHPIKTKDASSGITNVKTEKIRGKKLSDLDNRYKQTYSIYRYLLNNKKDKIDAIDIQTMEEFIADVDYYLQDVSGESELPSIGGLTQNYQMLEAGWKYDIN